MKKSDNEYDDHIFVDKLNIVIEKETYYLQDLVTAVQKALCSSGAASDVDQIDKVITPDGKCFQIFVVKGDKIREGFDIRKTYCSDKEWSPKKQIEPSKLKCGNRKCDKLATKWCSKCNKIAYCSVDCQKIAWKSGHSNMCRTTYSTTDFWRWFSTGKCSIIHAVLNGVIKSILSRKIANKQKLKTELLNSASNETVYQTKIRIVVTNNGNSYKIVDASLSVPYKSISSSGAMNLGYQEAIHVYPASSFNKDNISLSAFKDREIDRLEHAADGSMTMKLKKCVDANGKSCSKKDCVLSLHLKGHQLSELKMVQLNKTKNYEIENQKTPSLFYFDMAGMQFGHDELMLITEDALPKFYGKFKELDDIGVYSKDYYDPNRNNAGSLQDFVDHLIAMAVDIADEIMYERQQ